MSWIDDPKKREAVNEHGYRITWAHHARGTWHNAWTPAGRHIDAGYNKAKMQAACEAHKVMLERQRLMKAARKASVEVE